MQVITSADVAALLPGTTLAITGRVLPADAQRGLAATLIADRVDTVRGPPPLQVAAGAVRPSLRASVADRSSDVRGLLPWGSSSATPPRRRPKLEQAMRDSGLAHLTAVSGGNVAGSSPSWWSSAASWACAAARPACSSPRSRSRRTS